MEQTCVRSRKQADGSYVIKRGKNNYVKVAFGENGAVTVEISDNFANATLKCKNSDTVVVKESGSITVEGDTEVIVEGNGETTVKGNGDIYADGTGPVTIKGSRSITIQSARNHYIYAEEDTQDSRKD